LRPSHASETRLSHATGPATRAHVARRRHPCRTTRTRHVRVVGSGLHRLARIDFRHSTHAPAAQSRVLIAVSPAVHGSLNQTSFATKTWIEFRQRPSYCVALGLIDKAVAPVLILGAASPRVDAIFSLELGTQSVDIDRLDIAANCVFHLYSITRVLKGDPLHSIAILSDHKRGRRRDGAWSRVWIHTTAGDIVVIHVGRPILWMLWWAQWSRWWSLQLRHMLHLSSPGAARHSRLLMLARVLHWMLPRRM